MISRRELLAGFLVTAGGLLVPEPVRVYSFAKPPPMYSVLLLRDGETIRGWEPGEVIRGYSVAGKLPFGWKPDDPEPPNKIELVRVNATGKRSPIISDMMHPFSSMAWSAPDYGHAIFAV